MSSNQLPEVSAAGQDFARIWGEATARVLEQLHGSPFTATPHSPAGGDAPSGDALWARFKASGRLNGELAFQFPRTDGIRMAQLLMSEPMDSAAAFTETHADGIGEVFRQFAGGASSACKAPCHGEVGFAFEANTAPDWEPAGRAVWVFAAPKVDPLQWTLLLSRELHESFVAAKTPSASTAEEKTAPGTQIPGDISAGAGTVPGAPSNLELLLDVELEASLRFGQREMLLRDVLELHAGSVIELDRRIQEPAELVVAGRVIARGEVVVVDGNYGLRITDIAQPNQRLASLEA